MTQQWHSGVCYPQMQWAQQCEKEKSDSVCALSISRISACVCTQERPFPVL